MSGRCAVRRVLGAAIAVGLATAAAAGARAEDGLADLRLFVSPERRAALDGEGPAAPSPEARAPVRTDARANAGGRRDAASASGAVRPAAGSTRSGTPPGTATVRSSRGTSRIVDGVPLPGGPS